MHHCLDGDGLSVAGRTPVDDASLPWHLQTLVRILAVKESVGIVDDVCLRFVVQYHIIPTGVADAIVQFRTLLPVTVIKDPDLVVQLVRPGSGLEYQSIGSLDGG